MTLMDRLTCGRKRGNHCGKKGVTELTNKITCMDQTCELLKIATQKMATELLLRTPSLLSECHSVKIRSV